MKTVLFRMLALVLAILCFGILFTACQGGVPSDEDGNGGQSGTPSEEEKPSEDQEIVREPIHNIAFTRVGNPTAEKYPSGEYARIAWDMIIWKGKLYLGSGDYGNNLGPAAISCYDLETGVWEANALVPDEEVNRFCVINGELCAPGIDPRDDWTLGNYYVLNEDGTWRVERHIPGGVHQYDMVEHEGMIFVGLGVEAGGYPVAVSDDGGTTFYTVCFKKSGAFVDTSEYYYVRTYDLFCFEDELYATLTLDDRYELYRYSENSGAFVFAEDLSGKMKSYRYKQNILGEKVYFDGEWYITTGYFYQTSDLYDFTRIKIAQDTVVSDLVIVGDTMYVLGFTNGEDKPYRTVVYALEKGSEEFDLLFDFEYDVPGISFAVNEKDFYIGMGHRESGVQENGDLLRVTLPD